MRLKAKLLRDYVNIVSRVIETLRDNMAIQHVHIIC